ncbi:TPA: hypothetical protein ACPUPL_000043 [Klebsiella pneumoniae]
MTKSTITREQLEELAAGQSGFNLRIATHEESQELARMVLATLDSEPVAVAENGPSPALSLTQMQIDWICNTCATIYHTANDDVAQGYIDEIRATLERMKSIDTAQQTPVVPEVMEPTIEAIKRILPTSNPDEYAACIGADMWNACRAAMLHAQYDDDGEPTDDERIMAIEGIHNCERCGDEGWVVGEMGITRCACGQAGNSPVIGTDLASGPDRTVEVRYVAPPGYVMVPMRLTAENGAKGALSGEFSETRFVNCPECFGDDECETCDGSGKIEITVPVTWTTIKAIWAKGVEHFTATPREVKGE